MEREGGRDGGRGNGSNVAGVDAAAEGRRVGIIDWGVAASFSRSIATGRKLLEERYVHPPPPLLSSLLHGDILMHCCQGDRNRA